MKDSKFEKTIVLLDSHAILHRAYHAMPDFKTRDGVPTGALYGFLSMVLGIIDHWKPHAVAACFDLPKPTFRHEAFAEYKGTRKKTDGDLVTQIKSSRIVCQRLGIPIYDAEGFEADDVLGAIANQLKVDKNVRVVIATGDMDTLQLVDGDQVLAFMPKKGIRETVTYNEQAVIDRHGFGPELVPDYKGLRGDPSDNIPGIPKVGDVTATKLILAFGSIGDIYKAVHADNAKEQFKEKGLRESLRQRLIEHEDDAFFSKTLATIRLDVPVSYSVPAQSWQEEVSFEEITSICNEYSFRSLVGKFERVLSGLRLNESTKTSGFGAATKTVVKAKKSTAPPAPFGESAASNKGGASKEDASKWFADLSKDQHRQLQIMVWLLNPESTHPSNDVILKEFGSSIDTFKSAHNLLEKRLAEKELLGVWNTVEEPLVDVIAVMESHGVLVNRVLLKEFQEKSKAILQDIDEKIRVFAGEEINIRSTKQLSKLLFETLGLSTKGVKKTKQGSYSTNESVLEKLKTQHEVIGLILEYRSISKFLSTYVESFLAHMHDDGRIYAQFLQDGAATGRFSSQSPNMQNLPNGLVKNMNFRNAFIAPVGKTIIAADYSQIELRVAAMMSQDPLMLDAFEEKKDIHTMVASRMFEKPETEINKKERRAAKAVNFGMLFGMGPRSLGKNLEISFAEAKAFHAKHKAEFARVHGWLQEVVFNATNDGYTTTWWGRKRWIGGIYSNSPMVKTHAQRTALNAPIQGTAADIIKLSMIIVQQAIDAAGLSADIKMILQVHDEIVFEVNTNKVNQAVILIKQAMESVVGVVPVNIARKVSLDVDVEIGQQYGHMEKWVG